LRVVAAAAETSTQAISQDVLAKRRFRALARKPWVIACVIALIVGGVVAGAIVNIWLGVGVAVGGPILFLYLVPGWIASSRAEKDFFTFYAATRRLDGPHEGGMFPIPGSTPLLMKGVSNQWQHLMFGALPGGVDGVVGRYTFVIVDDSGDDRDYHYFHFTAAVAAVAEAARLPNVYCHRHILGGGGGIQRAEDVVPEETRRISLESTKVDKQFDIRVPTNADDNMVRQIFTPVFVDWLAESAPEGFCFEAYGGSICAYVEKQLDRVDQIDAVCEGASFVAKRFRGEADEPQV